MGKTMIVVACASALAGCAVVGAALDGANEAMRRDRQGRTDGQSVISGVGRKVVQTTCRQQQ
jgi:hypothetical protein